MPRDVERIYCDSCVFISYIEETPGRITVLDQLFTDIGESNGDKILVTSALAKVEVAFSRQERDGRIVDPAVEAAIDALWSDASLIEIVELSDPIAKLARQMMRRALGLGIRPPKPPDAVHLATAKWIKANSFFTYDLTDMKQFVGDIGCEVQEPHVAQARLIP
jgi:predicted nucleic acid-binding protein